MKFVFTTQKGTEEAVKYSLENRRIAVVVMNQISIT
jgi:hypothetical protein